MDEPLGFVMLMMVISASLLALDWVGESSGSPGVVHDAARDAAHDLWFDAQTAGTPAEVAAAVDVAQDLAESTGAELSGGCVTLR